MKCDDCINQKIYRTGSDEYPSCTTISYCSSGHWENGYETNENSPNIDVWDKCNDFKQQEQWKQQ